MGMKDIRDILLATSILGLTTGSYRSEPKAKPYKKKEKNTPVPKGCKEYFFDHTGDFINHNDGFYAFKCVASNDKNAIRKYENWVKAQK